eukprot:gene7507-biopygen18
MPPSDSCSKPAYFQHNVDFTPQYFCLHHRRLASLPEAGLNFLNKYFLKGSSGDARTARISLESWALLICGRSLAPPTPPPPPPLRAHASQPFAPAAAQRGDDNCQEPGACSFPLDAPGQTFFIPGFRTTPSASHRAPKGCSCTHSNITFHPNSKFECRANGEPESSARAAVPHCRPGAQMIRMRSGRHPVPNMFFRRRLVPMTPSTPRNSQRTPNACFAVEIPIKQGMDFVQPPCTVAAGAQIILLGAGSCLTFQRVPRKHRIPTFSVGVGGNEFASRTLSSGPAAAVARAGPQSLTPGMARGKSLTRLRGPL